MTSSVSSSVAAPTKKDLSALWVRILTRLEEELPRSEFITWFRDTAILSSDDATLVVGLPLPTFLDRHLERFQEKTLEFAKEEDSTLKSVVYQVDVGLKDDRSRSIDVLAHFPDLKKRKLPNKPEVKMAEGIVSKILNPKYTLDNFVVGTKNRLAHAAASAVASDPGGKYNPLFIYGGVGLGKTHLLQGIGNAILQKNPQATVVYTTSEDFTNQVVEAIRLKKMDQVRKRYRGVDTLIVDDIQFFASKDRCQEEFFHTFNALFEGSKQLIISSDKPPDQLHLEPRLISRFERGMIADVSEPDFETRLAILQEKVTELPFFIDMEVLQFIAEHTMKNVRELEGILMQAVAQYELEQRVPNIKSIAEIMRKLNKDPHEEEEDVGFVSAPRVRATFKDVLEKISEYYSVSIDELVGPCRKREILHPRQMAMYISRTYLKMSFSSIGELFGNRDHTTVMNACDKMEGSVRGDAMLLRELNGIASDLKLR